MKCTNPNCQRSAVLRIDSEFLCTLCARDLQQRLAALKDLKVEVNKGGSVLIDTPAEMLNYSAARTKAAFKYDVISAMLGQEAKPTLGPVPNHIKYPQYFKDVRGMQYMDVYAVHKVFAVEDSSGALQHASKKILLSGMRTGNKTVLQDITEARDALNRWIEMNQPVHIPGK